MDRRFRGLALVVSVMVSLAGTAAHAQVTRSELDSLMFFKSYTSHRVSSFDRSGANDDGMSGNKIQPGESRTIADLQGPGVITHIWFTIATPEPFHLKRLVMRAYWDGEASPSVETPVGDFLGLGLGKYVMYESGRCRSAPRSR